MTYEIKRLAPEFLLELEAKEQGHTVFTTYAWIKFLEKNQCVEPVILALREKERMVAVFVGAIVKKAGVLAVCDRGFAEKLKQLIADGEREEMRI